MTRENKKALCGKVSAKADEFAADPAKGRAAGYTPEQEYITFQETTGSLDQPAPIPSRDARTAWLYGIARRDLKGHNWHINDKPEGPAELVIV